MGETCASNPDTLVEPAEPHESSAMDGIPDVPVDPAEAYNAAMEASQRKNLNPSNPLKTTKDAMIEEEDVVITRMGHSTPIFNVLAKHTVKDVSTEIEKGKAKLDLFNIEKLNFEELHPGYLSRISMSRGMEAGLVNMMKIRYDETIS
ncbi:hypothetical protein D1007_60574 [Hordeum vulgare]|nr:hypothetical protein D1007_60574 [Hordeum vulgare]